MHKIRLQGGATERLTAAEVWNVQSWFRVPLKPEWVVWCGSYRFILFAYRGYRQPNTATGNTVYYILTDRHNWQRNDIAYIDINIIHELHKPKTNIKISVSFFNKIENPAIFT
jgi:hypothetical protein